MARRALTLVDLDTALAVCAAARAEAVEQGALVSVAVVDAGGHLVAFQRMDDAEFAGAVLARDKAYTAVAHRTATDDLGEAAADAGELTGLYANDGGRYVAFGGGLPVWRDGRVIAGIGVSGGTAAQDIACAEAALHRFAEVAP